MFIKQLQTTCLAQFAYYIESAGEAAIIDPIRETSPYTNLAKQRNAQIKYVLETHFHADFVSGHIDLAQKTGATLIFGEQAKPDYDIYNAKDNEILTLGKIKIQVIPTPGHTLESVSYLIFDEDGKKHAIFTGDALFVGDVGRPDLSSGNLSQEELAGILYDTIQTQFKPLPDDVIVYPAHGQGSACGKQLGPETFSTIGKQKKSNYALQDLGKKSFIKEVTDGLGKPPAYFFKDAAINQHGYDNIEDVMSKNLKALSVEAVKQAQNEAVLILDTRLADEFKQGFIAGSWNISLRGQFAPWVGALVPFNTAIIIIAEENEETEAVLRLARVGYENVLGFLEGGIQAWKKANQTLSHISSITADELEKFTTEKHPHIIDVRSPAEYKLSHLPDALNIHLKELQNRLGELKKDQSYLLYCRTGYRSMAASSILKSAGFENLTDLEHGYEAYKKLS